MLKKDLLDLIPSTEAKESKEEPNFIDTYNNLFYGKGNIPERIRYVVSSHEKTDCDNTLEILREKLDLSPTTETVDESIYYADSRDISHAGVRIGNFKIKEEMLSQSSKYFGEKYFWGSELIRLGEMLFLDNESFESLSTEIKENIKSKVLLINELKTSSINHKGFNTFNIPTITNIIYSGISNHSVLDLGAGDGFLSLAAAKIGNTPVIMVDNDASALKQAKKNFELNGFQEGKDFFIIEADLANSKQLISEIKKTSLVSEQSLILSNIGEWPGYNVNNGSNINLIDLIEAKLKTKVNAFIGGGYYAGGIHKPKEKPALDDTQSLINKGFKIDSKLATNGTLVHEPEFSFIAKK